MNPLFEYITPESLIKTDPNHSKTEYLIVLTDEHKNQFPIAACWSKKEAESICYALNRNIDVVAESMMK